MVVSLTTTARTSNLMALTGTGSTTSSSTSSSDSSSLLSVSGSVAATTAGTGAAGTDDSGGSGADADGARASAAGERSTLVLRSSRCDAPRRLVDFVVEAELPPSAGLGAAGLGALFTVQLGAELNRVRLPFRSNESDDRYEGDEDDDGERSILWGRCAGGDLGHGLGFGHLHEVDVVLRV